MSNLARIAVSIGAAALFAGCGGSQPPISAPSTMVRPVATPVPPFPSGIRPHGWLARGLQTRGGSSGPVIYVADQQDSTVLIYAETGGYLQGEITDGINSPYGLYVDKNGTLYVANEGNSTVTAYPEGSTSPSTIWSQDLQRPLYVMVDGSGDLFVDMQANGSVVEYRPGSTTKYQVLQTQGTEGDGMDFDSHGNLYVAYRMSDDKRRGGIEEFPPGTTQGRHLGMKLTEPQGLIVDKNGNILVVQTGRPGRIELFKPGHKRLSQVVRHRGTMTQIAIEANESELFASTLDGPILTIAYPFPPSRRMRRLLRAPSGIQGLALSNGQTF